jgi:hypothetical protein
MDALEKILGKHESDTKMRNSFTKKSAALVSTSQWIMELLGMRESNIFYASSPDYETGEEIRKPVLTKAGAEFLCEIFSLEVVMETKEIFSNNGDVVFHCTCKLLKDGEVLGEGRSAQSSMGFASYNTAVKMADKSAQVAAVVKCFNLSGVLLQDMGAEDNQSKMSRKDFQSQTDHKQGSNINPDKIVRLAQEKGVDLAYLLIRYNVRSVDEMSQVDLCDAETMLSSKPDVEVADVANMDQARTAKKRG